MFSTRRRILFFAGGSRGDCQPYVALARGLKEAGFVLQFITNINFCDAFKDVGIDALGLYMDAEDVIRKDKIMKDAMATGDAATFFKCCGAVQIPIFEEVLTKSCTAVRDFKPDLLMYAVLNQALALMLSFHFGIPAVGANLQYFTPTRYQPSILHEPKWLPGWCHLAAHFLLVCLWIKSLQPLQDIGQKALPDIDPYMNSTMKQLVNLRHPLLKTIIGASPQLHKVPPDVPPDQAPVMTGAWILDAAVQESLVRDGSKLFGSTKDSKDTTAFLEKSGSSPPVYMGWGSMLGISPEHMTKLAVRTLMVLGRRGIIVGGFAELKESMLEGEPDLQDYASKSVLFVPAAPHEVLFPKCAAVVHHGGAGTFNAGLRAGVPQVVTPCISDQFVYAAKVNDLKVGVGLPKFQQCTSEKLVSALTLVLSDSGIQETARQYARELQKEYESSVAAAVNEVKRDFDEEIDTGWAWIHRIFFSSTPNDFLASID